MTLIAPPQPGVDVEPVDVGVPQSAPDDISRLYVAVESDRGPLAPTEATSESDLPVLFGADQPWSMLYPDARAFFRAGGQRLVQSRVVGPAAATATLIIKDGSAVNTLAIDAIAPGESYNQLRAQVTNPSTGIFQVLMFDDLVSTTNPVEVSPEFSSKAAGVTWSRNAQTMRLRDLGAGGIPAVTAKTALAGGLADRASVTDADVTAALNRIPKDLGPGQVRLPGRTGASQWTIAATHATANNRVALLDAPATVSAATAVGEAQTVGASRYAAAFHPWAYTPGPSGLSSELVAWSAIEAGLIAATDATDGPAQPAAGRWGIAQRATDLSLTIPFTDAELTSMNANGVNAAIAKNGGFRAYGFRTLAVQAERNAWTMLSCVRVAMLVRSLATQIGENHLMGLISSPTAGRLADLSNDLRGMLLRLKVTGQLFGDDQAFGVNVGPSVNPASQLGQGLLRILLTITPSPFAERIEVPVFVRTAS